ncbi:MAG: hypothetical protein JXQ73_16545 [Phycisphaerae bacterium]|nr:hypothetical protein [Phycisphaerae bacterium]
MKVLRIIIGVLACLFIVMHLLEMPSFLGKVRQTPDDLVVSVWLGKISAVLISAAIAIVCFRRGKKPVSGGEGEMQ